MEVSDSKRDAARRAVPLPALGLGIMAERLLWQGLEADIGLGIAGFTLWIVLLALAACWLGGRAGLPRPALAGWSIVAVAAGTCMSLRASETVHLAMLAVLLAAASMLVLRAWEVRLGHSGVGDHVLALAMVPARALGGAVPLLSGMRLPREASRRRLFRLGRGLLLALPLLLVFGGLFAAADATFQRWAARLVQFSSPRLIGHAAFALGFAWLAAGLLSALPAGQRPRPARHGWPRLGVEESAVVMGLLCLLFLGFVSLQLGYLFGGRATIESISGLTVADHARRGFFELLVAAALTLAVLTAGHGMSGYWRWFRWLAAVLIGCVLVMLASALQRLVLYIEAFGLTLDRLSALVVLAWLGAGLLLFAATVLRGQVRRFASGLVIAALVGAFALALSNPAALVARVNIQHSIKTGAELDMRYLLSLGADALPVVMARLDDIPPPTHCRMSYVLLSNWTAGPVAARHRGMDDWRNWNAGRAAAWEAVNARLDILRERAEQCPLLPSAFLSP